MTDTWIQENAIRTAIYLPIICLIATLLGMYLVSLLSIKKAKKVTEFGLTATAISLIVSWIIIFVNL
jgi:Na+/H+-translocating membrane pyrophosphatase